MQAEIAKTNTALAAAQAELDALKQKLAHEKMEKASAQADLEAAKSKKPDTSEADGLRKELQALKDQHQAALMTAQQESAKATEEHLATKASLEKFQSELARQKAESQSDYNDMHDSMTQLVEEATKKAADVEARLKEAEANLKVKDAELAEARVRSLWSLDEVFAKIILTVCTRRPSTPHFPHRKPPNLPKGLRQANMPMKMMLLQPAQTRWKVSMIVHQPH